MNRRVTPGSPAGPDLQPRRMIHVADVKLSAGGLDLGVATQAEVWVTLDQHFLIDRTVRNVTDDAAFAHCPVVKNERAGLAAMTLRAAFIVPGHGQSARRLENITAMRVVALHAVHVAFDDRMMVRQVEFRVDVEMALEAGRRILARVDDKLRTAGFDVFAARSVAGFAAGPAGHRRITGMNPCVRAGGKNANDVFVAIRAGLVANVMRARNFQRHRHGIGRGGAGIQKQHHRAADKAQSNRHRQCPLQSHFPLIYEIIRVATVVARAKTAKIWPE